MTDATQWAHQGVYDAVKSSYGDKAHRYGQTSAHYEAAQSVLDKLKATGQIAPEYHQEISTALAANRDTALKTAKDGIASEFEGHMKTSPGSVFHALDKLHAEKEFKVGTPEFKVGFETGSGSRAFGSGQVTLLLDNAIAAAQAKEGTKLTENNIGALLTRPNAPEGTILKGVNELLSDETSKHVDRATKAKESLVKEAEGMAQKGYEAAEKSGVKRWAGNVKSYAKGLEGAGKKTAVYGGSAALGAVSLGVGVPMLYHGLAGEKGETPEEDTGFSLGKTVAGLVVTGLPLLAINKIMTGGRSWVPMRG